MLVDRRLPRLAPFEVRMGPVAGFWERVERGPKASRRPRGFAFPWSSMNAVPSSTRFLQRRERVLEKELRKPFAIDWRIFLGAVTRCGLRWMTMRMRILISRWVSEVG